MTFGVWVREMETIPSGYGVAWYSPWSARAFCVRAPFHRIAGRVRSAYHAYHRWMKTPAADWVIEAVRVAGEKGYQRGLDDGRVSGIRTMKAIMFPKEQG